MSKTIAVRDDYVILWNGPGWYADLGRWDTEGKSYVEGAQIASPNEFGEDGVMTQEYADELGYNEDPQIWNWQVGRGTPYWLNERPEEEK